MAPEVIFHIHYDHLSYSGSGSANRPERMKEGFEQAGFSLEVVEGDWYRRRSKSHSLIVRLRSGWKPDFLYAESSTTPYVFGHPWKWPFHDMDIRLMHECQQMNIPIGLFYRDAHWRFLRPKNLKQLLIRWIYRPFHQKELNQYQRYCDVIFLPFKEMGTHLDIPANRSTSLPPAAKSSELVRNPAIIPGDSGLTAVHVGGLTDSKGLYDLRPICQSLLDIGIRTTLVCRESEWREQRELYQNLLDKGLTVKHLQGEDLYSLLATFDFGLLCYPFHEYRTFAFPYKVFEYLQCGLTILHDPDVSLARWIQENGLGVQLERTAEGYELNMEDLESGRRSMERSGRIEEVLKYNTWRHRAQRVAERLTTS